MKVSQLSSPTKIGGPRASATGAWTAPRPRSKEIDYPSSDGKPMAETQIHLWLMLNTIAILWHFFRHRRHEIYVGGNMFLYYQKGNPRKRRAPDVMVVKGVDGRIERRSFKIWEEKAFPRTVLEFTSKQTAAEDLGAKKTLYRKLKVLEYFLFDPLHEYLPQPLMGFRLKGSAYQPMQTQADGSLVSEELGLRLVPEGSNLALYDLKTGAKLLPIEEALNLLEEMQTRAAELERELKTLRAAKNGRRKKKSE